MFSLWKKYILGLSQTTPLRISYLYNFLTLLQGRRYKLPWTVDLYPPTSSLLYTIYYTLEVCCALSKPHSSSYPIVKTMHFPPRICGRVPGPDEHHSKEPVGPVTRLEFLVNPLKGLMSRHGRGYSLAFSATPQVLLTWDSFFLRRLSVYPHFNVISPVLRRPHLPPIGHRLNLPPMVRCVVPSPVPCCCHE